MKNVLIAGATGYLGRYLIREAKRWGYWIKEYSVRAVETQSRVFINGHK